MMYLTTCVIFIAIQLPFITATYSTFGEHYSPYTSSGLCKDQTRIQNELDRIEGSVIRLESLHDPTCVQQMLQAVTRHSVWLGMHETKEYHDTDMMALQKLISQVPMDRVAGIHVSNADVFQMSGYTSRVHEVLQTNKLGHLPVVISNAISHPSRRIVRHENSNATNSTSQSNDTVAATTTTIDPFPNPTLLNDSLNTTTSPVPTSESTEDVLDSEEVSPTPPPTTTVPVPTSTSYFGSECPEFKVQRGDSTRAILARVCNGYRGPCQEGNRVPTIWHIDNRQCLKLLQVGENIRVCCQ